MDANIELEALKPLILEDVPSMSDNVVWRFRDSRGFNILMLAAEAGRLDVVQNLIDRGEDLNFEVEGESAASLAFKEGHHETVLTLLKSNAKFPSNFNRNTATDELKLFLDLSAEMHEKVKEANEENLEEAKNFLKQIIEVNSNLHYFYDVNNFSLLKCAILHKKLSLYVFLLSLNIFLAPHESIDEINRNLNEDDRETLKEINFRISPNLVTEPMMILMRNCKLGPDSPKDRDAEFMFYIRKAFDDLFMNPAIAIVLRIVAASRNFKIIFDFRRNSVTFLDPSSEPYTRGVCYLSGRIFVGAKDLLTSNWTSTVATIAHELTHYAMFLVYGNWAKPYKEKDSKMEARFDEVNEACKRLKDSEEIVRLVYDEYEEDMQHAELIVRVPHMIAFYFDNQEILINLKESFKSLFEFYEEICMPQMEVELPKIERKFSPTRKVEEKVKRQKVLNIILMISIIFGSLLFGFLIYWSLPVSWSDLDSNDQNFVKKSEVELYGVEVKFGEIFANDSKVFDLLSSEQIKKTLRGESKELSKALNETFSPYVFLTWSNMTQKLKDNFLTREVDFQGQKVCIGNLTKNNSTLKLLNSQEIREIFTTNSFKISFQIKEKSKIFIERFFVDESEKVVSEEAYFRLRYSSNFEQFYFKGKANLNNSKVIGFDKIVEELESSKAFLLSSAAGDGKSTIFRHYTLALKRKFPHKWIQFFDLKEHFKAFEIAQELDLNDFEILSNFLAEKVLNLKSFELELFKELFTSGNVIFLFDGVDEISPKFKDFMLKLTTNIARTENFQFISTRPQHSKDFQENLKVKARKLIPFGKLDRFEFLVKTIADKRFNESASEIPERVYKLYNRRYRFFKKPNPSVKPPKYYVEIAKGQMLFEASRNVARSVDDPFVSNPLLISMISEIVCDESFEINSFSGEFNMFEVYEIFIRKKLEIVDEKGKIVETDRNKVLADSSINIWQVHQFFALDLISKNSKMSNSTREIFKEKIRKSLKVFSTEQISRFGLLQVQSEIDYDFAHRSFAEFFIAQFFLNNLLSEDKWTPLLFELNRVSDFYKFIEGASIDFTHDFNFTSKLIKTAYSEFSIDFENILKFIEKFLYWPAEIFLKHLKFLSEEIKDSESFEVIELVLSLNNYIKGPFYLLSSDIIKENFETFKDDLNQKSKEIFETYGSKIRRGDFRKKIEYSKLKSDVEGFMAFVLPNLIKSAYSNNTVEFQNILDFIQNLTFDEESLFGYNTLLKEAESRIGNKKTKENIQLAMMLQKSAKEKMDRIDFQELTRKNMEKHEIMENEWEERFKIRNLEKMYEDIDAEAEAELLAT